MVIKLAREYAKKVKTINKEPFGKSITAKVAGVTFDNRQYIINLVDTKTKFSLKRDEHNEFDKNAVSVEAFVYNKWHQVGFLPKDINESIANEIDRGILFSVQLKSITGDCPKGLLLKIQRS